MNNRRNFPRIIAEIAMENGYTLNMYGGGWLLELYSGDKRLLLHGYKFPINDAAACVLADDKSTLSELLKRKGISAIPHYYIDCRKDWHLCENYMYCLLDWSTPFVVKPNNGTGGQDVFFANSMEELEECMDEISIHHDDVAISPYVCADAEYRVIIYNGEVEISFEKVRKSVIGDGIHTISELSQGSYTELSLDYIPPKGERVFLTKKHNLALGACPKEIECDDVDKIYDLAKRAIAVSGLKFASVDILRVNEELFVLEINSGVMTECYSTMSDENYARAKLMYSRVIADCFKKNKEKY